MSNFCSAFDNRGWSSKPSGGNQRRFEPGRHSERPPLSSLNHAVSRPGAHSHQTEREGYREGRRDGVDQWGRQQFDRPSAKFNGGPGNERWNVGYGTNQPAPVQVSPSRTAIKDLCPHQPNTVSKMTLKLVQYSKAHVCGLTLALLQWGQGGPWLPHFCPVLV